MKYIKPAIIKEEDLEMQLIYAVCVTDPFTPPFCDEAPNTTH